MLDENDRINDGLQIAIEIKKNDDNSTDNSLARYLKQEKVEVFTDIDATEFIEKTIKKISQTYQTIREFRDDFQFGPSVFISYSHKDKYIALPLFKKLHSEGIPVWLDDEELDQGDDFKERITNAIDGCKCFMPILSTTIKEQLSSGKMKDQWYYNNEWVPINNKYLIEEKHNEEARIVDKNSRSKHSFKIIPFIVGEYNYKESYHQLLPECFTSASISERFVLAENKVDYLKEIINKNNEQ